MIEKGRFRQAADRQKDIATLALPFFKELLLPLGLAFPVMAMLVMMGASNAVNLTDGLDGLAIVPAMIAAGVFLYAVAFFAPLVILIERLAG